MRYSKFSALAVGLLLPTIFAAPSAPSTTEPTNQDATDALISALKATHLAEGHINFQAEVTQKCMNHDTLTSMTVEAVLDGAGKVIAKPSGNMILGRDPVPIYGLPVELLVSFKDEAMRCESDLQSKLCQI
jgi:hypothetical protein